MSSEMGLDTEEALDAVSRRASVIECLMDGPKYNRDLRDELDVSRSTAYKAVTELEEMNIARRGDQGYELTLLGRLLFEQYREFYHRIEDVCRPGRLLSFLAQDADLPFAFLDGATVSVSKRHAPNRPVREIEALVTEASKLMGTGPVVLPRYVELFTEQIVAGKLEAELVYAKPVFQHLLTSYEEDFKTVVRSDNLGVWVTTSELPYALIVVEEPVHKTAIVVYDSGGEMKGVIQNDSEQAYEWGCERWRKHRRAAVTPSIEVDE